MRNEAGNSGASAGWDNIDCPADKKPKNSQRLQLTDVTLFTSAWDNEGQLVTLRDVARYTRTGEMQLRSGTLAESISAIRSRIADLKARGYDKKTIKDAVAILKKRLPAVAFSGHFVVRKADAISCHTLLLCGDLDGLNEGQIREVDERLRKDPHVVLLFLSPTGTGLKVVFLLSGLEQWLPMGGELPQKDYAPLANSFHAAAYVAVERYMAERYKLTIDPQCKDSDRLCFLSHDSDCYWNWSAVPLFVKQEEEPVQEAASTKAKSQSNNAGTAGTAKPASKPGCHVGKRRPSDHEMMDAETLRDLLSSIPADDRGNWFKVLCALKWWGQETGQEDVASEIATEWAQTSDKYDQADQERTWDSLRREGSGQDGKVVTVGTLVELAKTNGWKPKARVDDEGRIILRMFGAGVRPDKFCERLYDHLAKGKMFFVRGGQVFRLASDTKHGLHLTPVKAAGAVTLISQHARILHFDKTEKPSEVTLREDQCRVILESEARFRLPAIESLAAAPVLCEANGRVEYVDSGYSPALGIYVTGQVELPPISSTEEAVANLLEPARDYSFASPSDKSRYIAAVLTPAFKQGRFIKGAVPVVLFEADDSQSGKTNMAKTIPAVYGETPASIAPRKGGVGSLDEAISEALIRGHAHILIDNWRGSLNSALLESALTAESKFSVRAPRTGNLDIDVSHFFFGITSNGMHTTVDLCNRALIIRIKKRKGYTFPIFAEGNLWKHVLRAFPRFLASVYTVLVEWLERGRPRNSGQGHAFVEWAGVMDWIVQDLFHLPPLLDGHDALARRTAEPSLSALRLLCIQADKAALLDKAVRAHELADMAMESDIDIGVYDPKDPTGPQKLVGKIMAGCFRALDPSNASSATIELDGFYIRREQVARKRTGIHGPKESRIYCISKQPIEKIPLGESRTDEEFDEYEAARL